MADASDPNTGTVIQAYRSRRHLSSYEGGSSSRGALQLHAVQPEPLESVNLFVPGLIALVLTLVSALMTAISLSREKEAGTLEVLLVSPLRPDRSSSARDALPRPRLRERTHRASRDGWCFTFRFAERTRPLAQSIVYLLEPGAAQSPRRLSQRAATLAAMVGPTRPSALLSGMIFPIASMPGLVSPVTECA